MKEKIFNLFLCLLLIISIIPITAAFKINSPHETINTIDNSPPNKPIIIIPDTITAGKWFKIEAFITDPDGDDIYVRFDAPIFPGLPAFWWGPIPSGIIYKSFVKYIGPLGTYTIGVQAKDIHDAESEWTYVQFNVTKNKSINSSFLQFCYNHLELFPIFRFLVRL
jgi:hypothetical protein